jgi:hypothetical protein
MELTLAKHHILHSRHPKTIIPTTNRRMDRLMDRDKDTHRLIYRMMGT